MQPAAMKQTIDLTLIKEEQPYLVAGRSHITGDYVFGFPYFHKVRTSETSSKVCPCIILPAADDRTLIPDDSPYAFACTKGEFHPIEGELHRFVSEDENGTYHFEGGITFQT